MQLAGTGMVVVSDITGDVKDIHPKDKHDVGRRLANWALAETYHRTGLYYKNPRYGAMETKGDRVTIQFENAPHGLMVKGPAVKSLMVAGENRVFYPAEAKVEGDRIVLWSREVPNPVAVRYQFSNAGIGNLFSKEGLPVEPFRTDQWQIN